MEGGHWQKSEGAGYNFQRASLFSPFPLLGRGPRNDGVFICLSLLSVEHPNIFMCSIWLLNSVPVFKSEHHPIRCGLYISCVHISSLCCLQSGLSWLSASSTSSLCWIESPICSVVLQLCPSLLFPSSDSVCFFSVYFSLLLLTHSRGGWVPSLPLIFFVFVLFCLFFKITVSLQYDFSHYPICVFLVVTD